MKLITVFALCIITLALASPMQAEKAAKKEAPAVLDFTMKDIDGKEINLAKEYAGKTILLVNVASRCGYTKQYKGLQELYDKYKDKGFVIIGVPANNFGGQEPGTNDEIKEFCSSKFAVTFPMLAKVSVKGDDITPLYKHLTGKDTNGKFAGDIKWNFEKFLISPKGEVVKRYASADEPSKIGDDVAKTLPKASK